MRYLLILALSMLACGCGDVTFPTSPTRVQPTFYTQPAPAPGCNDRTVRPSRPC